MKCLKCGNEFNGNFCPNCGTSAHLDQQSFPDINIQTPPTYQNPAIPQKKKGGCLKGGLIVLGVVVGIGIISSIVNGGNSSKPAAASQAASSTIGSTASSVPTSSAADSKAEETPLSKALSNATKVDYKTLHKEYMDNPIGADAKYKDKMLTLTGKVDNIDREIAGNPYVTFNVDTFQDIRIDFDKGEEEKVGKLKKGQTITVVGTCKGTLLSTTVVLDDSLLVK